MGNKAVRKHPSLTAVAFLRTKFSRFLIFSNTGNFGNYYSKVKDLKLSTVGRVPSIAISHMKKSENSEVYGLPLCHETQSLGSASSLVADSQFIRHVKKEMFPRVFYIKFIISTSLIC